MVIDLAAYRRQKRAQVGRERRWELSRIIAHGDERLAVRALVALEGIAQKQRRMDELHARLTRATGLKWGGERR